MAKKKETIIARFIVDVTTTEINPSTERKEEAITATARTLAHLRLPYYTDSLLVGTNVTKLEKAGTGRKRGGWWRKERKVKPEQYGTKANVPTPAPVTTAQIPGAKP